MASGKKQKFPLVRPSAAPTVSHPAFLEGGDDHAFRRMVHDSLAFAARIEAIRDGYARLIGISGVQYTILIAVNHLQFDENVSVTRVAEHLHLSGAFITNETNKLARLGLLEKQQDPEDGRRLILRTTRWEILGREHYDAAVAKGGGLIGGTWHGRLCLAPYWRPPTRHVVGMISANRDGDLIAGVLRRFGVTAVRGSSYDRRKGRYKGGAEALAGAEQALSEGNIVVITPDGPRGPRMRAEPGIAMLSIRTGAPICPIAFSTVRGKVLRSWDRFLVPFPFGRGVQIAGEVLQPPTAATPDAIETYRQQIEAALTSVATEADRLCGREPILPEPMPAV